MECATAKDAWDAFANLFKSKSQARRLQLKGELSGLHKEAAEPFVKYFARAKHLKSQLLSVGTSVEEDELCLSVLNGLPEEYATLTTVLITSEKALSMQDMLASLLVVENKVTKPVSESKAYVARQGGGSAGKGQSTGGSKQTPKETRKCHHCGKTGHLKKDCWKRQREASGASLRWQALRPAGSRPRLCLERRTGQCSLCGFSSRRRPGLGA